MKAVPLVAAPLVLAAIAAIAPAVEAEDTVRVCIAASTDGQTLRQQGKLLAAREQMIACGRDACPPIVRAHCARWLSELDAAIPSVVVRAQDASGADVLGAHLSIDGRPEKLDGHAVRLDPGPHSVAIDDDHGAHKDERVLLAEGETSRLVTLRFPAPSRSSAAQAPPPPQHTAREGHVPLGVWILGGLGVVALGGATYFALAANGDLDDLKSSCSPHCSDSQTQPGRTDALLFDVLLGTGAAAVAGAVIWGLAFPSHGGETGGTALSPRIELRPVAGGAMTALTLSY